MILKWKHSKVTVVKSPVALIISDHHQRNMTTIQTVFRGIYIRAFPVLLVLVLLAPIASQAGSYEQKKAIHDSILASSRYTPFERPLRDQSEILYVRVMFELVTIVEINDVVQSFMCNGFLGLRWMDEILTWNSSDYGGVESISPKVTSVFRPMMVMLNTLGDRDLFEDDHAPLTVYDDGLVTWAPGSIFPASCKLDLTKFPFDEQHCYIQMGPMNFDITELMFVPEEEEPVGMSFFTRNGLWDITNYSLTTPTGNLRGEILPSIMISFNLKRKPTFLVISILLPIVFLSLLNLLVFVIPVESGEKISYGITVLLALTVFMSIMSGMLPSSSESMPLIISYIFSLLTISVLTVVDSIIIVKLYHMEEKEDKSIRARANFKTAVPKIGLLRSAVSPLKEPQNNHQLPFVDSRASPRNMSLSMEHVNELKRSKTSGSSLTRPREDSKPKVNKYKSIGRHIDKISLVLFGVVWASVTLGFMVAIAA